MAMNISGIIILQSLTLRAVLIINHLLNKVHTQFMAQVFQDTTIKLEIKGDKMKKISTKGFTLVELIIVMVLLGILAAVAVPRMSQSIMAAEEAAEQKFLSSLVSAIEIYAADEFVRHSEKRYPDFDHGLGPFAVLDKVPQRDSNGEGWWVEHQGGWNDGGSRSGQHFKIKHRRNDGNEYTWDYRTVQPYQTCCRENRSYTEQGEYTLEGPGLTWNY